MSDYLTKLQLENNRLHQLVDQDELTGILNRRASEAKIRSMLTPGNGLFVLDLDYFKRINDKYGHLKGDECLKKTAELLTFIMRDNDIIGRIGGDEFIIYASGQQTEETLHFIRSKIQKRFLSYSRSSYIPIHISIGCTLIEEGDTYETAFERADDDLFVNKELSHTLIRDDNVDEGWAKDMNQIRKELTEEIHGSGAFAQDYESFKTIYHFLERGMRRNQQKACIVLLSVVDENGESLYSENKADIMNTLGEVIQSDLRLGDVFTRYSSSQYLVLLCDVSLDLSEMISNRIKTKFLKTLHVDPTSNILVHYSYELEAVKVLFE